MTDAAAPTGTLETALAHGNALLRRDPAMAEEQAREILRIVPGHPSALTLHGQALAALDRGDEAAAVLREAVRRNPDSALAWRSLAELLLVRGDDAGADQAQAQAIRASVNDPRLREAAVALCRNDLPVAERLLKTHLKAQPNDVPAIRMLAELAGRIGRYPDAENLLRRALELAPGFAPARFNLATVLYRGGKSDEALAELERLLADDPENPAYRNLMGVVLIRSGDLKDAVGHFEKALERQPGQFKIWLSYGHALKTLGRQADSIAAYRRAIDVEPGFGEAWWSLANLKTLKFDAGDVAAMRVALANRQLGAEDRFHLHFALAKALEDTGDYAAAFENYSEGNRLRLEQEPYDPARTTRQVDRTIALFTPEFLKAAEGLGCDRPDPIFVLGMPRAGSTLVEQILASHPQVEGTHELPDVQMFASRLAGEDEAYPDVLSGMAVERFELLGAEYIERTKQHRKLGRVRFIDKMPNNWLHAGLIRLILPNAKIIDARRHPLACCVANFRQHFARGQDFSYDLEHMGRYYRDYVRLMAHFDTVAPGMVHRVHYEAVVADLEGEVRRMLDFLGLPFDEACLRYHETDRAVRTASSEQVRQPIYREGLDQWRNFAPWLGPLERVLEREIAEYPEFTA